MKLVNPSQYQGCCSHPKKDTVIRTVRKAVIKRSKSKKGGYDLYVYFEGSKSYFYDWSMTRTGAKHRFAYQFKPKSKWKQ